MAEVGGPGAGGGGTPSTDGGGGCCCGGGGYKPFGAVRGTLGPKMFPGIGGILGGAGPLPVGWMLAATVGIMRPGMGCPGIMEPGPGI